MLFPTLEFALFFLIVFTVSWLLNNRHSAHKLFLVLASYFFYGYWDKRFVFLLFGSSLLNYIAGRLLDITSEEKKRKWIVGAAVAVNLGALAFFKYYGFFIESLADIFFRLGLQRELPLMQIVLPVGISFFTFQGISYVVDVYRGHVKGGRSLLNVILYISFFPQLVAGPIVRAAYFLPQLDKKPDPDRILAGMGFILIFWGVFKKAVVANYLATELVDPVFFDPAVYGPVDLIAALYGYSMQIYCDFSAYSDIATGVAALLGYRFPRNFNQPWRSQSLGEFWQRWHISLSTWLRDYLFIPLGGSRGGKAGTSRNLFITMYLGGIWHGAGWTYLLWSLYLAGTLTVERLVRPFTHDDNKPFWRKALNVTWFFNYFAAGWILFRATSLENSWRFLTAFGNLDAPVQMLSPFVIGLILSGFIMNFGPSNSLEKAEKIFAGIPLPVQGVIIGLILTAINAFGPEGVAPFIYFQF